MRANEFIVEGRTGSLAPDVAHALPATYRFGVAIAGAKGADKRKEDNVPAFDGQESAWGENEIVVSYGLDLDNIINDALKTMGLSGKKLLSTKKSEETTDVNNVSLLKGFKGFK